MKDWENKFDKELGFWFLPGMDALTLDGDSRSAKVRMKDFIRKLLQEKEQEVREEEMQIRREGVDDTLALMVSSRESERTRIFELIEEMIDRNDDGLWACREAFDLLKSKIDKKI